MKITSVAEVTMLSVQIQGCDGSYSLYEYYPINKKWNKTHPYIDCLVPVDIQIKLDKLLEEYYAGIK